MFFTIALTISRFELLDIVKKHSVLLRKESVDDQDVSDVEKNHGFWHDVMELYFVTGKEARRRLDDDLIFFVRKTVGSLLLFFFNAFGDIRYVVLFSFFPLPSHHWFVYYLASRAWMGLNSLTVQRTTPLTLCAGGHLR